MKQPQIPRDIDKNLHKNQLRPLRDIDNNLQRKQPSKST